MAVAGLNPHAGENGIFGSEDADILAPAVAEANAAGILAAGPIPADALFPQAVRGKWEFVIACYHDQGHAPFKSVYGDDGVNITVGLPVVRVSVDHGTAFDIAGKGIAREDSLVLAAERAANLAPRLVACMGNCAGTNRRLIPMAPRPGRCRPRTNRSGDLPLHAQMAAQLRGAILDGRVPAGTALPSEAALCERYGVARSVVRQALASLAAEGLIRRETGRPAVVAVPQQHRRLVQRSTGFHQQLAQSGVALETRVLGLEPADAPAEVAAFFGTGQLLRLERLRHVGGTPLAYAHLAARRPAARAERGAVENASLHAVLQQRYGLQPHSGRNRIRAVAAD